MSGSGSSGGFGSGGGGSRIDCGNFSFETLIQSPDQNEINKLSVGDVLSVELAILGAVEVVQVVNTGRVVGGLVDRGPSLKQCLEKGFNFKATVRSISGAAVRIFIESV